MQILAKTELLQRSQREKTQILSEKCSRLSKKLIQCNESLTSMAIQWKGGKIKKTYEL